MKDDAIPLGISLLPFIIMVEAGVVLLLYSFTITPFQDPVQLAELIRIGDVYLI